MSKEAILAVSIRKLLLCIVKSYIYYMMITPVYLKCTCYFVKHVCTSTEILYSSTYTCTWPQGKLHITQLHLIVPPKLFVWSFIYSSAEYVFQCLIII